MNVSAEHPRLDLTDRTVLITGANAGIGYWCAELLAARGARVLMACRSAQRAAAAASSIRSRVPQADLLTFPVDLGSLDSIRRAAATLDERIDVLICNAGVKVANHAARTSDGLDLMMGTNFLGHFALIAHLESWLADDARLVTVGSLAHRFADLDPTQLAKPWRGSSLRQYARSKAALMAFTFEIDRRWAESSRSAVCAHPGYAVDPLTPERRGVAEVSPLIRTLAAPSRLVVQGKDRGALPIVHAATAAGVATGDYWGPSGFLEFRGALTQVKASAQVRSVTQGGTLWSAAETLTGARFHA